MPQSTNEPPKFISPPQYFALQDLSHDPKLAEALGNMVIAWAHAEIMIFATFARATGIGLNMAMESFARIPTFEARVKFVRAILGEWQPATYDAEAISEAVAKLAKLASTRNHWIHGDWCARADKSETVIFNHRVHHTHDKRRKPVKAADVMDHCRAVKERFRELGTLINYAQLEG
jgi:hypothetical protein